MKNFKLILSLCCLLIICAAGMPFCAEKQENAGEGKVDDVVIKEKDTFKIEKEKPPLDITVDHMKAVNPTLETGKYFTEGLADKPEIDDLNTPLPIDSDAPVSPWLCSIVDEPVITFQLGQEKNSIVSWEFIITDMHGSQFRVFSGSGPLPLTLKWDGRDESEHFMQVGKVYSYILKLTDEDKRVRTAIGKPFSIDAAIHQEKDKELYISISLKSLFAAVKEGGLELSSGGSLLLREAADIVKGHFSSPIGVRVYSENSVRAREEAKIIAGRIAEMLLLPQSQVKYEGYREAPENFQANIIMFNRKERISNKYVNRYANKALKSMIIAVEKEKLKNWATTPGD